MPPCLFQIPLTLQQLPVRVVESGRPGRHGFLPWDPHSYCPREESLEWGLACHGGLGGSLSHQPRRAMGSLWEAALSLVRGVIGGLKVVQDPVNKFPLLAL